jgi:hypothetical protein
MPTRFITAPAPGAAAIAVPLTVAGLKAWYDFSDATTMYTDLGVTLVTTDGQSIEQINDKSGQANHLTQTVAGSRPLYKTAIINGLSIGRFDATDDKMTIAALNATVNAPLTVFCTIKLAASTSNQMLFNRADGAAGLNDVLVYNKAPNWGLYSGVQAPNGGTPGTATDCVVGTFNGASSKLWVKGGASFNGNAGGPVNLTGIDLGFSDNNSVAMNGDYGECLVYDSALSLANINTIGVYLGAKWNFTWTTAT